MTTTKTYQQPAISITKAPHQPDNPTMTTDAPALPFGLEDCLLPTSPPQEQAIVTIFGNALLPNDHDSKISAQEAAIALDKLCPPVDYHDANNQDAISDYVWELCDNVRLICSCVPHDAEHPGQATLIDILLALRNIPHGTVNKYGNEYRLWKDLPYFYEMMDIQSGGPTGRQITQESIEGWHNQSAFTARCLAADLPVPMDLGVYALLLALEGEGEMNRDYKRDKRCTILAATAWMIHCAPILLDKAKANDLRYKDGAAIMYPVNIRAGELFKAHEPDAKPGLSGPRWDFWKKQFEALLQPDQDVSEDVRAAVALALEKMALAEKKKAEDEAERWRQNLLECEALEAQAIAMQLEEEEAVALELAEVKGSTRSMHRGAVGFVGAVSSVIFFGGMVCFSYASRTL